MKILAMDTSSVNATVALLDETRLLGEYTISNERAHSQIIMPMLESMLERCSVGVKDIDVFAVALGPGSFTGLRIGIAAMKTLAWSLSKKIIGISSLDAVAASFVATDRIVCPIFDARRNEVYNALYLNGEKITDDRSVDFDELLIELSDKKVVFAGDGVLKYKNRINEFSMQDWIVAPHNVSMQKASSLAYLAYQRACKNDFDNVYELAPIYLKLPQAEREYNLTHNIAIN